MQTINKDYSAFLAKLTTARYERKGDPDMGEVIAVGAGKVGRDGQRRPLDVKVGDKIIFGKYSGQSVKADGEELLVMREEDIFGIVE